MNIIPVSLKGEPVYDRVSVGNLPIYKENQMDSFNWDLVKIPFTTVEDRARVMLKYPNLCDFGICPPVSGRKGAIPLDHIDKCRLFIRCAKANPEGTIPLRWFPWTTKYGKEWHEGGRSSYMWAQLISKWSTPFPAMANPDQVCNGAMIVAAVLEGLNLESVYSGKNKDKENPSCWISFPSKDKQYQPSMAVTLSLTGQLSALTGQ